MLASNHLIGFGAYQDASFTPASVASLVAWYRADLGVTIATGVSQWADQSGNGYHMAQATGGNQPAYSASGGPNSQPCIAFTAASSHFMSSSSFASVSQPFKIFWVGKDTQDGTDRGAIGETSGTRNDIWDSRNTGWGTYAGGTQQYLAVSSGSWHMFEYFQSGASSVKRLDGSDNSASPGTNGFTNLNFGKSGTLTSYATVSLAEWCLYSTAPTGSDLTNLRSYFNTRYGLTA